AVNVSVADPTYEPPSCVPDNDAVVVGGVRSIWNATDPTGDVPAALVPRCCTVCIPSADTTTGPAYAVNAPVVPSRYSTVASGSSADSVTVTGDTYHPPDPSGAAGDTAADTTGTWGAWITSNDTACTAETL